MGSVPRDRWHVNDKLPPSHSCASLIWSAAAIRSLYDLKVLNRAFITVTGNIITDQQMQIFIIIKAEEI